MDELKEQAAVYYTQPQIIALKNRLKESIEQENNVEVLLQCEALMHSHQGLKYDEAYFSKMEEELGCLKGTSMPCCYTDEELDEIICTSENSGVVAEEEINAFFSRWENML